jgi:hypothetical protein
MYQFFDKILNSLERRFGSWAVPGLIRYLAIGFFGAYLLGGVLPNLGAVLSFDLERILAGEVWRVFTFIISSSTGPISMIGVLFSFFGMMLMFLFSDGLEQQWGVFRTNLYVVGGWAMAFLAAVLMSVLGGPYDTIPGSYLAMSIFFAFATYNPRFTIMLLMVIPTPIWVLAVISGVMVVLSLFGGTLQAIYILLCLSNYLVVAIPMRLSSLRQQRSVSSRRQRYAEASQSETEAFNTCAVCGATEITHPDKEFRVGADGKDYCLEHLPPKL